MGARGRWFESSYADYKQIHYQRVAQLVERTVRGGEVGGSFPLTLTSWKRILTGKELPWKGSVGNCLKVRSLPLPLNWKCPTIGGGVASKATGR